MWGPQGYLEQSYTLADVVFFVNRQREVIQTAVNFIKRPHFQVPEQTFLFMSGLSLSFIFTSTPGTSTGMSGSSAYVWTGILAWASKRIYL